MTVIVVGAGAFGGWIALMLARRGARVTVIDAWGPGNSRSSSGGETRVIRSVYGPDSVFTEMAARSLELWRESEAQWKRRLYYRTGMLWFAGDDDQYERSAVQVLNQAGVNHQALAVTQARERYPQINFDKVSWCIFEEDAGYLLARESIRAVLDAVQSEGGVYKQQEATPLAVENGLLTGVQLSDGSKLRADQYVFACGPWLGELFPVLSSAISPTRQEVFFFGTPAGDPRFLDDSMPVWLDRSIPTFYGIPGNVNRGFKVACDNRGPLIEPTSADRTPSAVDAKAARDYLEFRFPALKGAPIVETRVCQYENTPDHYFIIDRLPSAQNTLIAGGGSGHGFKHGPAVGERAARILLNAETPDARFSLERLTRQ